jgi:DNA helicase II / ATP-dependent DNA helicase PcrA
LKLCDVSPKDVKPEIVGECCRMLLAGQRAPSFVGRYKAASDLYLKLRCRNGNKRSPIAAELGHWERRARDVQTVKELRRAIERLDDKRGVVLSNIHRAKGAEWDHVFVLNPTEGALPFHRELARGEVDEVRRLFYVAVTRARRGLHLLRAPYFPFRNDAFRDPSRFMTKRCLSLVSTVA